MSLSTPAIGQSMMFAAVEMVIRRHIYTRLFLPTELGIKGDLGQVGPPGPQGIKGNQGDKGEKVGVCLFWM